MVAWAFIIESLKYAKKGYQEKAEQYFNIPQYKELTYYPKLKHFDKAIEDIRKLRDILGAT